jgi:hypothetical protein
VFGPPAWAPVLNNVVVIIVAGVFIALTTGRDVTGSLTTGQTLLLGIGMLIPCAALLLYNDYTNGSPFRLGYTAAQGHLNDLGFGMRGLMLYDAQAQRVLAPQPYAFVDALRIEAGAVLWQLARDVVPAFTALPLLATAYAKLTADALMSCRPGRPNGPVVRPRSAPARRRWRCRRSPRCSSCYPAIGTVIYGHAAPT